MTLPVVAGPTAAPAAGWYTDPSNALQQRWWDSVQWGPQTRAFAPPPPPPPAPAPVRVPDPVAQLPMRGQPFVAGQYAPGQYAFAPPPPPVTGATTTRLRKTNPVGFAGAVVGIGSFIINPLLLSSVATIILCIIGLAADERMRNEGRQTFGRGWIIAGLVIGCFTGLLYGFFIFTNLTHAFARL